MTSGKGNERGEGGGNGGEGDERDRDRDGGAPTKRFADLVGPVKPLRPGPPRRPIPAAVPIGRDLAPGPRRDTEEPPPTFRWPDPAERCLAAAPGVNDRQLQRLGRGEPAPGERIDLHGVRHDAAESLLGRRIEAARARGLRSVLVIHGVGRHLSPGEAVLREALPDWLTGRAGQPHVLAFAPAPRGLGDRGATIVLLRRPKG